jgi:6-phosphofructokinase 1
MEIAWKGGQPPESPHLFEPAGPRPRLFFDPPKTTAAIVTCGGLCPGLNSVIRSLVLQLHWGYGVRRILGFRGGYQGLDPHTGREPLVLTPEVVEDIHKTGGTILGTSRGPVSVPLAVDNLIARGVDILFTIGGDGTHRGSREIFDEARKRGHVLSVVGIPKTIDNDVPFVSRTFGYLTAMEEACAVITRAHTEAHSVDNGIAVVRLMGRNAGFIAVSATIASQDVNFCLIPEVPFALEGESGLLELLRRRVLARRHAVIVVAEGAGQELLAGADSGRDASGNMKLKDIGPFLRDRVEAYFKAQGIPMVMRYLDPSYIIRSCPPDAEDAILCDLFARNAAHAAMAGRTGIVIGLLHDWFVHVPIELLSTRQKRVDSSGPEWRAVLACTGQPARIG